MARPPFCMPGTIMPLPSSIPSVIDALEVPSQLTARVVAPGWRPLLHGYDVQGDLSRHYGFAEVILTALRAEAPDAETGAAFEVALAFAAPVAVTDAPAHAAMLARLCGARAAGVASVAGITLAEQARWLLDEHAAVLAWLDGAGELPASAAPGSDDEAAAVDRLRGALEARRASRFLPGVRLGLVPALVALFHGVALRERWQIEAAFCAARWPVAIAEAAAAAAGDLKSYPMRLPEMVYRHEVGA
jgi:hypothetical protein